MSKPNFTIWIVDDCQNNILMILKSFPLALQSYLSLRSFLDARIFLQEFEEVCRKQQGLPHFIFLDYFLGMMYGSEVLKKMFEICEKFPLPNNHYPIVIGHSSNPMASAKLVKEGADFAIPKIKGKNTSPAIAKAFGDLTRIQWMWENRKLWGEI